MLTFGALIGCCFPFPRRLKLLRFWHSPARHSGSFPFISLIPLLIDGQRPHTVHFSSRVPTQKGRIDFYIPMEKVRPLNLAGHADGVPWLLGATLGSRLHSQLESLKIQAAGAGVWGGEEGGRGSNVWQEQLDLL